MALRLNTIKKIFPTSTQGQLLLWIVLVTALRLLFIAFNGRELDGDEAQYWAWSQQLALGYHSKPPFIAWVIAASTAFLGHSEFAIRIISPLSYALSSYWIYLSAALLYNVRTAFWSGLSWLLLPGVIFSAAIISTDPLMLLFWSLAFYAFVKALADSHWRWWMVLGLALGLSILSKYTAAFFAISMLCYLILSPRYRHYLKSTKLYAAFLIALLILLPNLVWNVEHHFAAFSHVAQHNLSLEQVGFHPLKLLEFLAAQLGVFGPVLAIAVVAQCFQLKWPLRQEEDSLILCFMVPLFFVVCLEALLVRSYANWAAGIYVTATIWATHYLLGAQRFKYLKWSTMVYALGMLLFYSFELYLHANTLLLNDKINFYKRELGWRQAAPVLKELYQQHPDVNYLFQDRIILFKSLYYMRLDPQKAYSWNPGQVPEQQFDLNTDMNTTWGQNYILISKEPSNPDINSHFRQARPLGKLELRISRDKVQTLYYSELIDYKG